MKAALPIRIVGLSALIALCWQWFGGLRSRPDLAIQTRLGKQSGGARLPDAHGRAFALRDLGLVVVLCCRIAAREDERVAPAHSLKTQRMTDQGSRANLDVKRCPSFSFFVFRYSSACGLGVTSQGTRSTTWTPARSRASTFSGLFDSKRTRVLHPAP